MFWIIMGVLMFVLLQKKFQYHFYYIEQNQMFLFSEAYFKQKIFAVGGFSSWISEFLVQFFILPNVGALVVSVLLIGIGVGVKYLISRIAPSNILIALLPSLALLPMHFDFNYSLQGTVAYLMMVLALCLYVRITNMGLRMLTGVVLVPIVYVLSGSIIILMAVMLCLYECFRKTPKGYYMLFFLVEACILGLVSVYHLWVVDFRVAFTPSMYYHPMLHPEFVSFYSWIALPAIVLLTYSFRHSTLLSSWRKYRVAGYGIQLLLFSFFLYIGMKTYSNVNILKLQELDYYTRTSQWNKTIEECSKGMGNLIFQNHYHLALAHKGELSSKVLLSNGAGGESLIVPWNKSDNISTLLSDVCFSMGAVAMAQEMAFESYHSWSSNSRWFVFSSRRMDGLYTHPYIAHIDENGEIGKPFVLPQEEACFYSSFMQSFNIPEFVTSEVETLDYQFVRKVNQDKGIDIKFE